MLPPLGRYCMVTDSQIPCIQPSIGSSSVSQRCPANAAATATSAMSNWQQ